ncbi:hypothetical protein BC938DRAFT_478382 [Jimgerdemannia flammicorona]|uniref:Uncharacterized protein n=1 Tax=Jimgerdemannia flammicorona TaxID=994334 RepID=A0A433QYC6_9FUNG|nr:hypothetical protein BC938DRAFT_478382 [Jimgerdemannia flammicorona]
MAMLRTNFEFPDKLWWKKPYDDRNPTYFIEDTKRRQDAIRLAFHSVELEFWEGYSDLHRKTYLLECLSAEGNVDDLTLNRVEALLQTSDDSPPSMKLGLNLEDVEALPQTSDNSLRNVPKVRNILDAINNTFPSILFPELPIERFTPSLARELHRLVGHGLIENAGEYRTRDVMVAQEYYEYSKPD